MFLLIFFLFVLICANFIYFFTKIDELNKNIDELYDLIYDTPTIIRPEPFKKANITVLNRK